MAGVLTMLGLALALGGDPVDLVWEAPDECPQRDEVLEAVGRRVGAPAAASQADAVVTGEAGKGWVVDLKVTAGGGLMRRRVAGRTCREVVDQAVVLIASMSDPEAAVRAAPDPLAPIGPAPPRSIDKPPLPLAGFLRLSGTGSFGILPRWGGGPQLAGGVDIARARIEARTFLDAPQTALVEGTTASARFLLWSGSVLGCFVPGRGVITVPLCLGPELGWVRGQAEGFAAGRTAHRLVVDVLGSVALSYAPGPWLALRAEADGLVVLTPGRFVADDIGVLHRIRAGGVRLGVGVELRLPGRTIGGRRR